MDVIANGGDAHADPVFVRVPHGKRDEHKHEYIVSRAVSFRSPLSDR